jgi:hypothetical protein
MSKADYEIVLAFRDIVFIVDLDRGGRSVTNDADAVWVEVQAKYPGRRLVYRDSMGHWDEILSGTYFRPYHGDRPAIEVCECCERVFRKRDRCTNGRCPKCHDRHCTSGGETCPGHGRRWPEGVVGDVEHERKIEGLRKKYGVTA